MLRAVVVDLPLAVPFRGITRRQGVLLEGDAGFAEWSPFVEYADEEAAAWLAAALEALTSPFPAPRRLTVEVNAIVPALDPASAARRVRDAGCATAKVKVAAPGEGIDADVARVAAVRDAVGPGGRVRVDANGGWDVATAATALAELADFDLEYAEQPCATVPELAELRRLLAARGIAVPIAADESIRRADDPMAVRDAAAADVAVLKVQPLGGVRRCLDLADRLGMPVVVSSAIETSVGLRAGVALAAALPDLPMACGLETATLLADDVTVDPLRPESGHLPVRDVDVDPDALVRLAADDATRDWWLARLHRVAALVPGFPAVVA